MCCGRSQARLKELDTLGSLPCKRRRRLPLDPDSMHSSKLRGCSRRWRAATTKQGRQLASICHFFWPLQCMPSDSGVCHRRVASRSSCRQLPFATAEVQRADQPTYLWSVATLERRMRKQRRLLIARNDRHHPQLIPRHSQAVRIVYDPNLNKFLISSSLLLPAAF